LRYSRGQTTGLFEAFLLFFGLGVHVFEVKYMKSFTILSAGRSVIIVVPEGSEGLIFCFWDVYQDPAPLPKEFPKW
jgi:hypothetical protein